MDRIINKRLIINKRKNENLKKKYVNVKRRYK